MSAKGPELEVGATIPGTKYQVVKSLGAGGMGVVYQVVKPPNIQGVLKLMSTELTRHEEHRMRFFDEVRILAQLDHPNIVKVFDYDALPDGTPFYVMELLSGRTVRDVIYTMGRVPPRVAYEITRQLLEALQAAHTHEVPVIHRDIKPENIFLHAPRHGEPVVKLIDFGVSSVADRKHDGAFVGTWSYAAPEQIRGEKPTPATDLYAAGLVLYEMLAGVGPFDHYDDWTRVSKAQLEELPAPVSKFAPWVPASIVTLIQSALAKDPRVRPRDAYAFAERLFELEWASDGKDPHDMTAEGPVARGAAAARARRRRSGSGGRCHRRGRRCCPRAPCPDRDRRERAALEGAQHDHVDVASLEQGHGRGVAGDRSPGRRPAHRRSARVRARRPDVARRRRARSHLARRRRAPRGSRRGGRQASVEARARVEPGDRDVAARRTSRHQGRPARELAARGRCSDDAARAPACPAPFGDRRHARRGAGERFTDAGTRHVLVAVVRRAPRAPAIAHRAVRGRGSVGPERARRGDRGRRAWLAHYDDDQRRDNRDATERPRP